MTGLEMQIEFERLLYTSNPEYSTSQKLDTEEIFAYLNVAQLRVMKAKYFPSANILENVRIIQSNVEELKGLVKISSLLTAPNTAINITNGYTIDIVTSGVSDYLHYIRSDSSLQRKTIFPIVTDSVVPNKLIDYSEIEKVSSNVFNKPILRKPCVILKEGDEIIVFIDDYTVKTDGSTPGINGIYLTYLATPADISLSAVCELAEYLHEEVVATAVDIFRREKYLLVTKQEDDNSRNA